MVPWVHTSLPPNRHATVANTQTHGLTTERVTPVAAGRICAMQAMRSKVKCGKTERIISGH